MIGEKMATELNAQIKFEMESAYHYLGMAAWAESANLQGTARFFQIQAKEEITHAMKIFSYVLERGATVSLGPIASSKTDYTSLSEALETALKQERFISGRIDGLMKLAHQESDYATVSMLNWFVTEQVEEEAQFDAIMARLRFAGDQGTGLILIDNELGRRSESEED